MFWCIYFKSIIKMVHNFNKINPWSKWHNTARSVLINSSRTTNMRMVYILLRFYFSFLLFCGLTPSLFTAKNVSILQFSHSPMILVQLILWSCKSCYYDTFIFFKNRERSRRSTISEWIKYETNGKARTIIVRTCLSSL